MHIQIITRIKKSTKSPLEKSYRSLKNLHLLCTTKRSGKRIHKQNKQILFDFLEKNYYNKEKKFIRQHSSLL